jgi:colicin import membrane protein
MAANVPRVDAQGIAQGVKGGSTANTRGGGGGNALVREQQNQMNTYISLLIQELKKAHEAPPGVSDQLEARVTFDITASGAILNPRISKSSGDKAFDESVLEAFLRVRSIGPTPNRRSDTWTVTFKMRDES